MSERKRLADVIKRQPISPGGGVEIETVRLFPAQLDDGREPTPLEINRLGVVVTRGPYYGMKWWHLIFLAVAFKHGPIGEGRACHVPLTPQDRDVFGIMPDVLYVQVGRKANGRYYVKELKDEQGASHG